LFGKILEFEPIDTEGVSYPLGFALFQSFPEEKIKTTTSTTTLYNLAISHSNRGDSIAKINGTNCNGHLFRKAS
jgi:hypothetical protein